MLWQMAGPGPGVGCSKAGWAFTRKRVEGIVHRIVTHGWGLVPTPKGIWNGQPATVMIAAIVATGWPLISTRGWAGGIVAGAACAHWATALVCKRNPGMNPPISEW
jgi:hypothetical protein